MLLTASALAEPPRLVVRPHGTNELEPKVTSLQTGAVYLVMARTNSPDGHWMQLTGILGTSNGTATVLYDLSEAGRWAGLRGVTTHNLANWTFAVGSGEDSDGNELPDAYEDLVTRSDPYAGADPYGDPDGDGWTNLQEMQNGTDPLRFDQPPAPANVNMRYYANGIAKLTWDHWSGALPEYFVVEKAQRTLHPGTNIGPFILQPPSSLNQTNLNTYLARQRELQRRFGQAFSRRQDAFYVTSQFQFVAKVPSQPGQHDYSYTETNVSATPLSNPVYRVQSHYTPPLHAHLDLVNTTTIRQTMLPVTARQTTNGYDLIAMHPIPYAWYLLLVRDRNNPQWRASGYFASGTNRDQVQLHVDAKGMMHEGQSPIAMPEVKFVPDVVAPEFTAGWGEDSDGDGLPDIYEVLVTQTDPTHEDTGNTGILDGYKDPDQDGWGNLEEFRRRTNPLAPNQPPAAVELRRPNLMEVMQALQVRTDLRYEPQISVRQPGATNFQSLEQPLQIFRYADSSRDPRNARVDFDVRIAWRIPEPHPQRQSGYSGPL